MFRVHNAVTREIHKYFKEAGLWAKTNCVVPEWSQPKPDGTVLEAELDLVTWAPTPTLTKYIDVTVRHPLVQRYFPKSATVDSHANLVATQDKVRRYPPTAGIQVTPFAVETFGRLAPSSEKFLKTIADAAEQHDIRKAIPPVRRLKHWTVQLSRVLFRAAARSILEAQGCYTRQVDDNQTAASGAAGTSAASRVRVRDTEVGD